MSHVADYGNRFMVPPVLVPYGQELEPETHAVCLAGMLLRTLRMNLHITRDNLARLRENKAWAKLTSEQQSGSQMALAAHLGKIQPVAWIEAFVTQTMYGDSSLGKVGKPFLKALVNALGVREPVIDADGKPIADSALTDYENVPLEPLMEDVRDYLAREVLPHAADAWLGESFRDEQDKEIGRVGYEINFNRYFYKYVPPRKLADIDAELKQVEAEIAALLGEVTE